jgi:Ulp1 family protease
VGVFQDVKTCAMHVDSRNLHPTQQIKNVLVGYFKAEANTKFKTTVRYYFSSIDMKPVQENDDDCGVLALYFMREVAHNLMENPDFDLMKHLSNTCQQPKLNATMVRMRFKGLLVSDEARQSKRR